MAMKERADMKGEEYLMGRRAGVEGTHGTARKGGVEKTVISEGESNSGSRDASLREAARSLYARAVGPGEDSSRMGDQALRDR